MDGSETREIVQRLVETFDQGKKVNAVSLLQEVDAITASGNATPAEVAQEVIDHLGTRLDEMQDSLVNELRERGAVIPDKHDLML